MKEYVKIKHLLMLLLFMCSINLYSQEQVINIHVKNATLRQVFDVIESQTTFRISYRNEIVDNQPNITISHKKSKVENILNDALKNRNLGFRIVSGKSIVIYAKEQSYKTKSIGQEGNNNGIHGVVLDENGDPIMGANIYEPSSKKGAITDINGEFSLDVPIGKELNISYLGYTTIKVSGKSEMKLQMKPETEELQGIVVVGYGTQRKADLTGSVANVDAKKLNTQSNSTIGQALQGKIAGVDVVSQGGYPGNGSRIMVRGIGTLNNAAPLYIVDGMYMSSIDHINPSDIESIDVLKDASSAAIYGSRAANGVIIVTTKSGTDTEGVPEIKMSANIGVNAPSKKLDLLNAAEWAQVTTASRAAANLPALDMANDLANKEDNDWQDYMFSPALMQNYNLSVQGGGKYSVYYNSFGYTSQDGTMKGTDFQRFTVQSKVDIKKNIFNFGTNIILTYDSNKPMNSDVRGGAVGRALQAIPTLAKYDGTRIGGYGALYGDVVNLTSPMVLTDRSLYRNTATNAKAYANAYFSVEPIKGLKYKLNFTPDFLFYRYNNYEGIYDTGLDRNGTTQDYEIQTRTRNLLLENLVTYENTFGDHKLSLLAGYSYQTTKYRYLRGSGQGMPSGISELDAAASGIYASGNSYRSVLESWLGRVFYSYKNRYLLTATIRRDGSSKFGKDNHWGNFPSLSVGWNIAEEKFVKERAPWLDQLKLRAGYGELGNQEISNYLYAAVVTTGINYPDGMGGLLQGAFPKNFANPDIKWESTSMTNIGLDVMALRSRLSLTVDYYVKNTSDILLAVPIPISTGGANDPIRNAGKIRNTGLEFNLGWNDHPAADFSYTINALGSFNKNKVINMGSETQVITGGAIHGGTYTTRTLAGYPIGGFWLIPCDGYFNSVEEVNAYQKDGNLIQPSAAPGDIRFKDTNNDGTINDGDRVYSGSPFPDFTYSLNITAQYKNWDFSITFQGVLGNKIYNATRLELEDVTRGTNYLRTTLNSWTETNHNASVPRLIWNDPNRNARSESNRFLENGDYLRLRSIQLGYTLPKTIFNGIIKSTRVYATVDNLFTITGYSGFTPDVNSTNVYQRGFDEFIYPANRTIMLGVNVTF